MSLPSNKADHSLFQSYRHNFLPFTYFPSAVAVLYSRFTFFFLHHDSSHRYSLSIFSVAHTHAHTQCLSYIFQTDKFIVRFVWAFIIINISIVSYPPNCQSFSILRQFNESTPVWLCADIVIWRKSEFRR